MLKCMCTPFKSCKKRQRDIFPAWSSDQPRNAVHTSSPFRKIIHMCQSPAVQILGILRTFGEDCADEITWKQTCFCDAILSKHMVTCVTFWERFLLFFFTQQASSHIHLYDWLCFWTRCACSTEDILIIQGNQQSTLQKKIWTYKL